MMRQYHLGSHKVQQLKSSSKYIVLPAHWCKSNGIRGGDSLAMVLDPEGDLVLKAPEK